MSPRVRVVGWNVQPIVMLDDGDDLTPLNLNPQTIAAKDWPAFKAGGDEQALDSIRAQVAQQDSGEAR